MKRRKIVLAIGDKHCGARTGLTPPEWQSPADTAWGALQRICWKHYRDAVRAIGPVDVCIVNGDAIDGPGRRNGGKEQLTTDRTKQVDMALECLRVVNPKRVMMTYGTRYHTGEDSENWEDVLCRLVRSELKCEATIGAHETLEVNGVIFDVKHKIGSSQIPHGRHTATARAALWNREWARRGQRKLADIVLRSHVHYHAFNGDSTYLAMTLPALQGLGSEYGARECEGTVDFGIVWFDVAGPGDWLWHSNVLDLSEMGAGVVRA